MEMEGGKEYKNNKDNERYGYGYIYISSVSIK